MSRKSEYKVAIIGAGIAGLAAAKTLHDNNISNIAVIEAENYLGGRIKSQQFEDGFIEYGAQWLHGLDNKLKRIAEENGLLSTVVSNEGSGKFVRENGDVFDDINVSKVDFVVGEILSRCEKLEDENVDLSVGDYLRREFNSYIRKFDNKTKLVWTQLFHWHLKFQTIDNACMSLNDLSAARWGDYDFNGDESQSHISFKNGYVSIINAIASNLREVDILLNKPVDNIKWNRERNGKVRVSCFDGTILLVDHVICTVSLGVLKAEHDKMFSPSLPRNIVCAIESLGFGTIGKIILQFDYSWWEDIEGFQIVPEVDDKEYMWYHDISGFDVLAAGPSNCLIGWIGAKGVEIMETLSSEEVGEECLKILESATKTDIPRLKALWRSSWLSNPYVRGAYSHVTVQCNAHNITPSALHTPVLSNGTPVLLFAGEACHDTHFSTTHGAFESGEFQAMFLSKVLKSRR